MKIELKFSLRHFCIAQFSIVTIMVALGFFSRLFSYITGYKTVFGLMTLLDLGKELSIPTYVSILNLLIATILIYIIYRHEKDLGHSGSGYWKFLAVVFLFLSVDESAAIHEQFTNIHRGLVVAGIVPETLKTNRWIPFGILFVLVIFAILIPFIRKLPKDTRLYFLIAGSVFVAGAIGFEYVGAKMLEYGVENVFTNVVRVVLEEGFEMYGIAIFNCALYREILRRDVSLKLGG